MDTNPNHAEDLTALERRLSAWQPSDEGLDSDAVLFAAGRASIRPGAARFIWPTLTVLMTALSIGLGLWLVDERNERVALAHRLREHPSVPTGDALPPPSINTAPVEPNFSDELPPDSYLAARQALEKGLDAWPSRVVVRGGATEPSITNPPILRLGQRDALLKP